MGQKVELSYNGSVIGTMTAYGTKTAKTSGKYCEDDITVSFFNTLPAEYQEVEYIQCSGNQFVTLGQKTITNLRLKSRIYISEGAYYGNYFLDSTSNDLIRLRNMDYGNAKYLDGSEAGLICGHEPYGYEYDMDYNGINNTITMNDVVKSIPSGSASTTRTFYLFDYHGERYYGFHGKIYFIEIYDGTTKVFDLVPCYRKSDSVAGLYDLIGDRFFTSEGTSPFVVGGDVN